MLRVGTDYKILAVSENYWGKGNTIPEALDEMKKASGRESLPNTYLLYLVHPSAWVTQFGDIEWGRRKIEQDNKTEGCEPILFRAVKNGTDVNPSEIE